MKTKFIVTILITLFTVFEAGAFTKKSDALKNKNVFGIVFENNASVFVNAGLVSSISKQEYVLGTIFVSEIVIDTFGNSQIRIYNSSPLDHTKIKQKAVKVLPTTVQSATAVADYAQRAKGFVEDSYGVNLSGVDTVYKDFPATTHAKTIEFAISKPEELDNLYELLIADFSGTVLQNSGLENSEQSSNAQNNSANSKTAGKSAKSIEAGKLGGSLYTQD